MNLLDFAIGHEIFYEAFFRPGVQRFDRFKVSEHSRSSRRLAYALRDSRDGTIERTGDVGIPMDAANLQDTRPGFFCGFWRSFSFRSHQRFKNLRHLWEKPGCLERSAKESFQDCRVHRSETLKPKRQFGRNVFLVLDTEPE